MANLKHQLAAWQDQGLITPEQAEEITAYEAARPGGHWAYLAFLGLGASAVGIGLISMVAANWEYISDLVKLTTAFATLFLLTWGAWQRLSQGGETLLAVHQFASLACLALIAQVYHTGGKVEDALLFWSLITFPQATLARGRLIPMLWLTIFTGALGLWIVESHWFLTNMRDNVIIGVSLSLPYLYLGLATFLLRDGTGGFGWAVRQWMVLSGLLAVGLGDVFLGYNHWSEPLAYVPCLLLAVVTLGYLWVNQQGVVRTLAMAVVGAHLGQLALEISLDRAPIVSFLVTMTVVGLAACLAAVVGHQRLFNGLVLLLGLRLLMAYFVAAGGLAFTAFGLIFCGLMILGAVVVWRRQRHELHAWLEELR